MTIHVAHSKAAVGSGASPRGLLIFYNPSHFSRRSHHFSHDTQRFSFVADEMLAVGCRRQTATFGPHSAHIVIKEPIEKVLGYRPALWISYHYYQRADRKSVGLPAGFVDIVDGRRGRRRLSAGVCLRLVLAMTPTAKPSPPCPNPYMYQPTIMLFPMLP